MADILNDFMRKQLLDRRLRLAHASEHRNGGHSVHLLLEEVDQALARMEDGSFGICETCHDPIECDRLIVDPLARFCLDHLTSQEKTALEADLQLAARVQRGLLPAMNLDRYGWSICYHYEPAGLVSGDYCDVIDAGESGLYFMVGDVSGKGVAASMLMAHLHAMFRTLTSVGFSLSCILEHASRVFAESTLPNQYATLVCGRALPNGRIEIANAGHPAPLLLRNGSVEALETANLPIGMFRTDEFVVKELLLRPGEGLVIYSDGVSEATDISGSEYGADRLRELMAQRDVVTPEALLAACRDDLTTFRRNAPKADDVTLFVLGRAGVQSVRAAEAGVQETVVT
jgi:phosphoserine phosphatase RsbU/P